MQIDLIRHGECDDHAFLRGSRTDSELSQTGFDQLSQVFEKACLPPGVVIYSPLKRCASFIETLKQQSGFEKLEAVEMAALKERDFGVWDGLAFHEVEERYPLELAKYLDDPFHFPIPEAESLENFERRIDQAWSSILERVTENSAKPTDKRITVLTHGGVIRVLLKQILGLGNERLFQWQIGYGARLSLEVNRTEQGIFVQVKELTQLQNKGSAEL